MKLDEIDKQILAILEQDDTTPNRAIAERLDIAEEEVETLSESF